MYLEGWGLKSKEHLKEGISNRLKYTCLVSFQQQK